MRFRSRSILSAALLLASAVVASPAAAQANAPGVTLPMPCTVHNLKLAKPRGVVPDSATLARHCGYELAAAVAKRDSIAAAKVAKAKAKADSIAAAQLAEANCWRYLVPTWAPADTLKCYREDELEAAAHRGNLAKKIGSSYAVHMEQGAQLQLKLRRYGDTVHVLKPKTTRAPDGLGPQ